MELGKMIVFNTTFLEQSVLLKEFSGISSAGKEVDTATVPSVPV